MATLSRRALNRALLARQYLTGRTGRPVVEVVEHLVGMQAQNPEAPYLGLWTRVRGFRPDHLASGIGDRRLVRLVLWRGTIHLVSARDCLALRALPQPVLDRQFAGNHRRAAAGLDLDELAAVARDVLREEPMTLAALGGRLRARWPQLDAQLLGNAARAVLPLVQVPPRGLWGAGGRALVTDAESWLGGPVAPAPAPDEVVLRYLAAFGPATVKDVQLWSGLTRLGEVLDRLRPRLCTFRDEGGAELFDLPDAPRPGPDPDVPVRFLPEFDNVLLSHADRTRIVADDDRRAIFTANGTIRATVLVDGFVRGTWRIAAGDRGAVLVVESFGPLDRAARDALADEGDRLLAFAVPGGGDIEFRPGLQDARVQ